MQLMLAQSSARTHTMQIASIVMQMAHDESAAAPATEITLHPAAANAYIRVYILPVSPQERERLYILAASIYTT